MQESHGIAKLLRVKSLNSGVINLEIRCMIFVVLPEETHDNVVMIPPVPEHILPQPSLLEESELPVAADGSLVEGEDVEGDLPDIQLVE